MAEQTNVGMQYAIDDLEKVSKIQTLYEIARNKKRYNYDLWRRNYMLVHSRMWNTFPTTWMPTPTDNEMYPTLSNVVAWMTDQTVEFSCNPAFDPNTVLYAHAKQLSNNLELVLRANWEEYNWVSQIKLHIWDALIYGTGILKGQWNSSLELGLGNIQLVRVDPWTIYPDPHATSLDDASYIIEVKRMSFDELERKFPEHYSAVRRGGWDDGDGDFDAKPSIVNTSQFPLANPGAIPPATSNSYGLPGQSRRSAITEQGIYVYEIWYQDNEEGEVLAEDHSSDSLEPRLAPVVYTRWRVAVMAQGMILMDEYAEDLYGIDRHPYSRFTFEDLGEFWGVALATHIAPCQVAINRLLTCLQQNAELTANPIFVEPSNAGISRTSIINRPGTRLQVSGNMSPNMKPDWLRPPDMSQQIPTLIDFWIARMENLAGVTDINKGKSPAPRTAARQTNQAQEAGFVRIRSAQANLESGLKDIGTVLATLVVNNYTLPRLVSLTGDQQSGSVLKIAAKHFYMPSSDGKMAPLRFTLIVDAGADQPTSRQARISEADTLMAMGAIDQDAVLTAHNWPGKDEIIKRMTQSKQQAAAMGIMEGGPGKRVRSRRTS